MPNRDTHYPLPPHLSPSEKHLCPPNPNPTITLGRGRNDGKITDPPIAPPRPNLRPSTASHQQRGSEHPTANHLAPRRAVSREMSLSRAPGLSCGACARAPAQSHFPLCTCFANAHTPVEGAPPARAADPGVYVCSLSPALWGLPHGGVWRCDAAGGRRRALTGGAPGGANRLR